MIRILELPIEYEFNNQKSYLYPSLIVKDNDLTLVDTGYPGFLPLIEQEILKNGFTISQLKQIIITHYDDDHIGSLYEFKQKYPWIQVISSAIEAKYICGAEKSERLVQAEQMLEQMTGEAADFGNWFVQQLNNLQHAAVDQTVQDGDMILDNQCKIIATPGHTSGHISLYFPAIKAVVTGDAAVADNGQLIIANPQFCLNLEQAEQSLNKVKNLDAKKYFCYHGGNISVNSTVI